MLLHVNARGDDCGHVLSDFFHQGIALGGRAAVGQRVSTLLDTVGESFELNVAAAQEAGTLIKTARPIILAQGSVWEKWNYSYSRTAHAGSVFLACPASICLK